MLVKGDPGLLNAHILMKFRCNIYLSIQNMCSFNSFQNISIPFTILSNVFINYWLIYIVIKVKYKKMLWTHSIYFRDFKTPQFLHTCANLLALHSVKWFSFSDSLFFLIWCSWFQYNPVEMTFHSMVDCFCTCTLWIIFMRGIVRWTFEMPISSLSFACMILCKNGFLGNTSSHGGIWFLVAILS